MIDEREQHLDDLVDRTLAYIRVDVEGDCELYRVVREIFNKAIQEIAGIVEELTPLGAAENRLVLDLIWLLERSRLNESHLRRLLETERVKENNKELSIR